MATNKELEEKVKQQREEIKLINDELSKAISEAAGFEKKVNDLEKELAKEKRHVSVLRKELKSASERPVSSKGVQH